MLARVNTAAATKFAAKAAFPEIVHRAARVKLLAEQNASGAVIGIRSRDLLSGIQIRLHPELDFAEIGTDAIHRGFGYPAFHNENGRPWLTNALRDAFIA